MDNADQVTLGMFVSVAAGSPLAEELRKLNSGRARSRRLQELAALGLHLTSSSEDAGKDAAKAEVADQLRGLSSRLDELTELTRARASGGGIREVPSGRKESGDENVPIGASKKRLGMKGQFGKLGDDKESKH